MSLLRSIVISCLIAPTLYGATWLTDLDTALSQAKREEKPVLAYFTGKWCTWCQRLDELFLSQDAFDQLSSEMIFVKLEYPPNRDEFSAKQLRWKNQYKVFSYPSLIVIDAAGNAVGTIGYPRDGIEEFVAKIRSTAKLKQGWEKDEEKKSEKDGMKVKKEAVSSGEKPNSNSVSSSSIKRVQEKQSLPLEGNPIESDTPDSSTIQASNTL